MSVTSEYLKAALAEDLPGLATKTLAPLEVCVLDSGVDASHPDLAGRVIEAYRIETVDGKPQVESVAPGTNNDAYGHGTGVASIICRIAPNASIIDVRVLGSDNKGSGQALVEGLRLAVRRKARLVNMSLAASANFSQAIFPLCEKAYQQNQVLVAAKKNMPLHDMGFPAEFSNVISVDNFTFPSPFVFKYLPDQVIEYGAHGEEVLCAAPGGGYTTSTGTSFATPTVCGICTLIVGAFPLLRPFEVKTLLKAFADEQYQIE
jgi:subtilisin